MLTALKFFFDKFMYLLVNYWRVFIVVIPCLIAYNEHRMRVNEHGEFMAFKQEAAFQLQLQKTLLHNRELEIAKNRKEATEQQADIKLHYEKQIAELHLDRDNLKKELNNAIPRIQSLLDAVRLWQNRANTSGMPKDATATELFTESAGDCNGSLVTVIRACQQTTLDYNALYDWVLSEKKAVNGE